MMFMAGAATILPSVKSFGEVTVPTKSKHRKLRIAHLTDIHVETSGVSQFGMTAALRTVNDLEDKPDIIINGGDAIMNDPTVVMESCSEEWKIFHSILNGENSIPVIHCIGNHDLKGFIFPGASHHDSKKRAMEHYGLQKTYYRFCRNGWHVIVLDSIHGRIDIPGYFGKLDEEQFVWLNEELNTIPSSEPICVVSHIPILAACTLFDGGGVTGNNWNVPDKSLHSDAEQLRDAFFKHKNVKVCLSGHIHLVDHVNYLGIDYYCNGAVSGGWWRGNHQQFPPSFSVINLYDDGSSDREVYFYEWKN